MSLKNYDRDILEATLLEVDWQDVLNINSVNEAFYVLFFR